MARQITPKRTIDLAVFAVGFKDYYLWLEEQESVGKRVDNHAVQVGKRLVTKYASQIQEGLESFRDIIEDNPSFSSLQAKYKNALSTTNPVIAAFRAAHFYTEFLPKLQQNSQLLSERFPANAARSARALAVASEQNIPQARLQRVAAIPSISRAQVLQKWLEKAAEYAGVKISTLDSLLADSEVVRDLAKDLRVSKHRLENLDPNSIEAVDLEGKTQQLAQQIETTINMSRESTAVQAAAVAELTNSETQQYLTITGKKQTLSPQQEEAMMVRGKSLVAAGAGSGKTRVLASKVVYHIQELGFDPSSIMATSFSRKSAAELQERIAKYGAPIEGDAATGFGTTHSIAGKILRSYPGSGKKGLKNYETDILIRLAMAQVKMSANAGKSPPAPKSIFGDGGITLEEEMQSTGTLYDALYRTYNLLEAGSYPEFFHNFIESMFDVDDRFYALTHKRTKGLSDINGFSSKQQKILKKIFKAVKVTYDPSKDPYLKRLQEANVSEINKKGSFEKDWGSKYRYFKTPAKQWFNLGSKLTTGEGDNKKDITPGQFKTAISKFKGSCLSPSEAWQVSHWDDTAAVYAAYEWLKSPEGEAEFAGKGDFSDVLLDVSKLLIDNPDVRKNLQQRFKCILVDEAQDLNKAQHVMFGLIAGWLDPEKVPGIATAETISELAFDSGEMTADTYTFIGDDKQAIYEFRGADPDVFIEMSDLVEGGAGFNTILLDTNYRSGKAIIEAAGELISHNKKQIPMVCEANPSRLDPGAISSVSFNPEGTQDAARFVAEEILDLMESGGPEVSDPDHSGYDSFGVGVRSNAEAYQYSLEMLKRSIPFRSKANFFKDKNTKALIHWLTLAEEGLDGNAERINEAVIGAIKAPVSMLGSKFVEKLQSKAEGSNYLIWLSQNPTKIFGARSKWTSKVKAYVENLMKMANLKGNHPEFTSVEILNTILGELEGVDGTSMKASLIEQIKDDEDVINSLISESEDGVITEEQLTQRAYAPIEPLKSLLENQKDLVGAMSYVRKLQKASFELAADDDPSDPKSKQPAVTIGTMHSWKGLEVPNMYIPFVGGKFPRLLTTEEEMASERRLAYVAITRGKNRVRILDIPTVTKQGKIAVSPFVAQMCLPIANASTALAEDPMVKEASTSTWSPHDPAVMEAFLRGEDPFLVETTTVEEKMVPKNTIETSLEESWGKTLRES